MTVTVARVDDVGSSPAPAASPPPDRRPTGPRARGGAQDSQRLAARSLALLGVLLLGFVAFLSLLTQLSHSRAQTVAHRDLRFALANQVAPLGQPVALGTPTAYLSIPSIGISEIVLEGTTSAVLTDGPGHRRDSVLPGQMGNSILVGRRTAYGGPFRRITALKAGASISVLTAQGLSEFTVDRVVHAGDRIPLPTSATAGRLTLITAEGSLFLPERAVYVQATMKGNAKPGYVPVSAVPSAEQSLGIDTSAALPLALWSQALLLVVLGLVWLRPRWGRVATYACGLPVTLAVLWNVYDTAASLLPNAL